MFFPEVDVPVVRDGLSIVSVQDAARPGDQIKENWILNMPRVNALNLAGT